MFNPTYLNSDFLYKEHLDKVGIREEDVYEASKIVCGAFGTDFFENINKGVLGRYKNGIAKFMATNLIYQYFTIPMPENVFWLIELAKTLKIFAQSGSIKEYIARLKDERNVYPAFFELLFAKTLYDGGHVLELQKKNIEQKPVEVFTEVNGIPFRIECKTVELLLPEETFSQKILRKLDNIFKKIPEGIAMNIILSENIERGGLGIVCDQTVKDVNDVVKKHEELIKNEPRPFKLKITYGEVLFMKFDMDCPTPVQDYFHLNSTEYNFLLIENPLSQGLSKSGDIRKAMGIKYDKKIESKARKLKDKKSFISDIKQKISQQKKVLESGGEVVIVLDKKVYDENVLESSENDLKFAYNYKNLSIILAHYKPDFDKGEIKKEYFFIVKSINAEKLRLH